MKKIAFLDRDGVINAEVNYLHKISDFEFTELCVEGLHSLKAQGYEFVIVTNQAGIAKGLFSYDQYRSLTSYYVSLLEKEGLFFLDIKMCPHHPEGVVPSLRKACSCRKPEPGMLLTIMDRFDVDLDNSIMVGDKISDLQAGERAGINKNFLMAQKSAIAKGETTEYVLKQNLLEIAEAVENYNTNIE